MLLMREFIFGTDWWSDCDDAVAARLLVRAHASGEIKLLGAVINATKEDSVASLDGFLSEEGLVGLPIGIDREATDYSRPGSYQARLVKYAKTYKSNEDAEDGVRLYRRLLSEASDKVELVEVGFFQVVAALIESEPDDISPLSGIELMKQKVSKIWAMAGRWDRKFGHENNFDRGPRSRAAAAVFCEKCPVPVTFLGFEIGFDVISGSKLSKDDILFGVLADHGSAGGRSSWDPMTALMAVVGDEEKAGYTTVRGQAFADADTGTNIFEKCDTGPHLYVKRAFPPEYYASEIDKRIN